MATVESWFWGFFGRHLERIPREDWALPESSYWAAFQKAILRHGVTEAVADAASELMAERESVFPDKHLAAFIGTVKEVWKASEQAAKGGSCSRDEAAADSRSCPDCGGCGLATRFRHESITPQRGASLVLYCVCSMGRWIRENHFGGGEANRAIRMHDLADHPKLQLRGVEWASEPDNRYRYRPDQWDETTNRPRTLTIPEIPSTASLRSLTKRAEDAIREERFAEVAAF